jgi:type IV pilus assembly protein PilB
MKGSPTVARKGDFTEILLRKRIISQDQLNEAKQVSKEQNTSLPETIIKLGYASGEDVMRAVAQEHGRDYVDLTEVTIPEAIIELVPESVARENVTLPLAEEEDALKVIVSDPYDIDTIEKLRFILNRRIEIALAPREKILRPSASTTARSKANRPTRCCRSSRIPPSTSPKPRPPPLRWGPARSWTKNSADRPTRATHDRRGRAAPGFGHPRRPFEEEVRIRYRIDGMLHQRDSPPRRLLGAIISRIKILAKMDIAERRRPQDGRIKITVGDKELDLRVSIIPTNHGQSAVMRLLDKDNIKVGVRQLGLSETDFQHWPIDQAPTDRLVTGPTGSGKTTTLLPL